jgi:phosphopantetheine adenylyltransferase
MATPVVRTESPQKTIQINKNQHKRGTTEFQKTAIPYKQNQSLNADHRSTTVEDGSHRSGIADAMTNLLSFVMVNHVRPKMGIP